MSRKGMISISFTMKAAIGLVAAAAILTAFGMYSDMIGSFAGEVSYPSMQ